VIIIPEKNKYSIKGKETGLMIQFTSVFPELYKNYISNNQSLKTNVVLAVYNSKEWIKDLPLDLSIYQLVEKKNGVANIKPNLVPGKYFMRFSISSGEYPGTHNSDKIELVIE
jgi:hypothetical protein